MSFEVLPNEVLKLIISFLCKTDAKNVALTSKRMYGLALDRIWYKIKPKPFYCLELWQQKIFHSLSNYPLPKEFLKKPSDPNFYKKLSHLPIREMSVMYFPKWSYEEVKKALPQLKVLHFDNKSINSMTFDWKFFSQFKMPMVINTEMFRIYKQEHFDEFLQVLKTCNVVKLIIDHPQINWQTQWPFNQFERIINEVPKITISMACFAFTSKSLKDFFQIISKNKGCEVYVDRMLGGYLFTTRDIELMATYDIKITKLSSRYLKIPRVVEDDQSFRKFADALLRLKHLKSFEFYFERDALKLIEYFVTVPITECYAFKISEKDKFDKAIKTLSKIKSLRHIFIGSSYYKFLPEDLAKFKGLPVRSIHLDALDLTKENIPEFRRIMMQMNIEKITRDEFLAEAFHKNEELGIEVKSHGLGGIYKTI